MDVRVFRWIVKGRNTYNMNTQLVLQLYIELSPLIDLKHEHTHTWLDGSATGEHV